MEFNHFLTSYMPDPSIGSQQHFKNMIDQESMYFWKEFFLSKIIL